MEHKELIRTVPGSPVAVLMIHGIAGTPMQFRDLVPLIPEDWTLHNIMLDGHGKEVEDFSHTSMEKWHRQVEAKVEELLSTHEKLIMVGHSMGTLFSIRTGVSHPDRVPFLFLLSVPSRAWVRFSTVTTIFKVRKGKRGPVDDQGRDLTNISSIHFDRRLRKYLGWIPRFLELLTEIRRVRRLIPKLEVPAYAFQSEVDELVSIRSCKDLAKNPRIQTTVLRDSGHCHYGPDDLTTIQNTLKEQIRQVQESL